MRVTFMQWLDNEFETQYEKLFSQAQETKKTGKTIANNERKWIFHIARKAYRMANQANRKRVRRWWNSSAMSDRIRELNHDIISQAIVNLLNKVADESDFYIIFGAELIKLIQGVTQRRTSKVINGKKRYLWVDRIKELPSGIIGDFGETFDVWESENSGVLDKMILEAVGKIIGEKLGAKHKIAFALRVAFNDSYREIAETMGCSTRQVNRYFHDIRNTIKEHFLPGLFQDVNDSGVQGE